MPQAKGRIWRVEVAQWCYVVSLVTSAYNTYVKQEATRIPIHLHIPLLTQHESYPPCWPDPCLLR